MERRSAVMSLIVGERMRLLSGPWGHATTENGFNRLGREFGSRSTAYIYPVEPRKEPNLSYRLLRAIYPLFRVLFRNQGDSR
jgi:hypothetical protein